MSTMARRLIIRCVLLGLTASCRAAPTAPIGEVPAAVANAPTEVVVENATLRLTVYPWRNFQPSSSPDTRLMTQFQIVVSDGAVPSGLRAEKAWLVRDGEAWITVPRQEMPSSSASKVEFMSRGGPTWPVGSSVMGVLLLRDTVNNSYLLRSPAQTITRAD